MREAARLRDATDDYQGLDLFLVSQPALPKYDWFQRLSVDFQPEYVGPRIVPHHIEVELRSDDLGSVKVRRQNALRAVLRSGQLLAQRADDAAATTDPRVLGSRESLQWISGKQRQRHHR